MASTSQSDILLHLLLNEIKTQASLDLTPIKILVAKINPIVLSQLSKSAMENSPLCSMVQIIVENLKKIVNDAGRVDLNDTPKVLDTLKVIFKCVGELSDVNISAEQLVEVSSSIIIIVLNILMNDPHNIGQVSEMVSVVANLVNFAMPVKSLLLRLVTWLCK